MNFPLAMLDFHGMRQAGDKARAFWGLSRQLLPAAESWCSQGRASAARLPSPDNFSGKTRSTNVRDSGLLHQLLGIPGTKDLLSHPKVGASWEGFVIEQVLSTVPHDEAFFWSTHQGAEIDLVLRCGTELFGIECKRTDAPRMTPSIRIAVEDLGLARVAVIYPGTRRYPITDRVEAVPIQALARSASIFDSRSSVR